MLLEDSTDAVHEAVHMGDSTDAVPHSTQRRHVMGVRHSGISVPSSSLSSSFIKMGSSSPLGARVCVDILGSCCHWGQCWFQWSGLLPRAMFVSRDNAITRAVPSGWPELPPRAMVTTDLGCFWGLCLGPWLYRRWGLCWSLWPILPPKAIWSMGSRLQPVAL